MPTGLRPRALTPADAERAVRLSDEAGWNQTAADWRLMLRLGRGVGIETGAGDLIATIIGLPHGLPAVPAAPRFAWVSMVLVTGAWRRRGLARWLLGDCLDHFADAGLMPVLDATPDGRLVYRQLGFVDGFALDRMAAETPIAPADTAAPGAACGLICAIDDIAAYDAAAFGADRRPILDHLHEGQPGLAHLSRARDAVVGHVLARAGRRALHLGPIVADDAATAVALLGAALRAAPPHRPIVVDAFTHQAVFRTALCAAGFRPVRSFTRMHRGDRPPTADAARLFAAAGPEFG